ncbi:hypothetical protein [Marinobacter caseinilyticus]|uniref:hypothetical protein n=1 Tax=Marinobacter caseinilyticus TaxID=2692195 RepID=UPI001408AA53|nr:hypothetical protein [Marinobacter caseinilyticus]
MKVYNDERDMVFDNADPRCVVFTCHSLNHTYGFVQCLNLNWPECGASVPEIKRYWGPWDVENPEDSVRRIMAQGGKWPTLPPMERYEEYAGL